MNPTVTELRYKHGNQLEPPSQISMKAPLALQCSNVIPLQCSNVITDIIVSAHNAVAPHEHIKH